MRRGDEASPSVVGVLGGTFDPVHSGHLWVADRVRHVMALSSVLLLPTAVPPHKKLRDLAPAHHREAMLRLALAERKGLSLCTLELVQNGVCYSIDTLRKLREGPPHVEPLFCLGLDALLQIHTWREYRRLLAEFDLIVVDRAAERLEREREQMDPSVVARLVPVPDVEGAGLRLAGPPPGKGGRIFHVPIAPIPISSSEIRARAASGASLESLVPAAVARYIERTGLYRGEERR